MKRKLVVAVLAALVVVIAFGAFAWLSSTPVDAAARNCANVRCASCPDGYHWKGVWPQCCTCVPN